MNARGGFMAVLATATFGLLLGGGSQAKAAFVITPTFTANFNANFGANAAAAQAAWINAANVFTSNFSDNIHVNITVDAVAGSCHWIHLDSHCELYPLRSG